MHEVDDPGIKASARKVAISASISLFVMLIDLTFVFRDEFEHVLSQLRTSWRSRLYVSVRIIGLLGQIFNVYFTFRMYLGIYTSPAGCYVWFSYQALIIQILLFYVEFLLAKRVFALFLGSQAILVMLISFLLAQVGSMVISAQFSIRANQYTPSCWVTKTSPGNAFFSATTMTTHAIIFFMTFWRFFRLPKKFTQQGLGWTVFRDSTLSLAAISVIMLFLTLTSLRVIKPTMGGNVVFSWLVCTLWMSMGHIYVIQEKIKHDAVLSKMWEGSMQLTSQIEMGDVTIFETTCSSLDSPMASTLEGSLSTPTSKASQLLPPSVCTSNGPPEWLGDPLPSSAGPGSAPVGMLVDTPPSSSDEGTSRKEDAQDHRDGQSSSLQPRSQPPSSDGCTNEADVREHDSGDDSSSGSQPSGMGADADELSPSSSHASDGDTLPTEDPPDAPESSWDSSSHPPS